MKRRGPLRRLTPLRRGKRLNPMSAKRLAIADERRSLVERVLRERPVCEVNDGYRCLRASVHLHERLTRARGGSILDPTNVIAVCWNHHGQIHDNPDWATSRGLLTHSWEAR